MPPSHPERIPYGAPTAIKLVGKVNEAGEVMREIGCQILGEEVLQEAQARLAESADEQ